MIIACNFLGLPPHSAVFCGVPQRNRREEQLQPRPLSLNAPHTHQEGGRCECGGWTDQWSVSYFSGEALELLYLPIDWVLSTIEWARYPTFPPSKVHQCGKDGKPNAQEKLAQLRNHVASSSATSVFYFVPLRHLASVRVREDTALGYSRAGPGRFAREGPTTVREHYFVSSLLGQELVMLPSIVQYDSSDPTKTKRLMTLIIPDRRGHGAARLGYWNAFRKSSAGDFDVLVDYSGLVNAYINTEAADLLIDSVLLSSVDAEVRLLNQATAVFLFRSDNFAD